MIYFWIIFSLLFQGMFKQVAFNVKTRMLVSGYTTETNGEIFYESGGKMVTYLQQPEPTVVINSREGQVTIYNQKSNQVVQKYNPIYSSDQVEIVYFLKGGHNDLGLSRSGFTVSATEPDGAYLKTTFNPPMQASGKIGSAVVVYDGSKPVYLEYTDHEGETLKKVYFYDFIFTNQIDFPTSITKIDFLPTGDSTIAKSYYSNIRWDEEVDQERLNFEVPDNAQMIK